MNFLTKVIVWAVCAMALSFSLGITLTWQLMVFVTALSVLETVLDIVLPTGVRAS